MNNNGNNSFSTLESQLLLESGRVVSELLGIRIRICPSIKVPKDQSQMLFKTGWMINLKWRGVNGILHFYFKSPALAEMLAIDKSHLSPDDFHGILYRYAVQFSENFSKRLTILFVQSWQIEYVEVVPLSKMNKTRTSTKLFRIYDIYTGSRFLFHTGILADTNLLRLWREQWKGSDHVKLTSDSADIQKMVSMLSKSIQMPGQFQWPDSLNVELPVSAELGQTHVQLKKILDLGPGDILDLNKIDDDPVDLYVNRQKIAEGRIIHAKGKIGIQVTALIGPEDRMRRLLIRNN